MKTITKSFLTAVLALSVVAFTFAQSPPTAHETLNTPEQFQHLKVGDKIIYACNQCKTVSEVTIESAEQAMEHCKEGSTLMCPACKTKVKVTYFGSPRNQTRKVVYTNDKGEECLFVASVAPKS